MMTTLLQLPPTTYVVEEYRTVQVSVPERPLVASSLQVSPIKQKKYSEWTKIDSLNVFEELKKIVSLWRIKGIADQYLVYGKQRFDAEEPFNWEIVPYYQTKTIFGRLWQQCVVLWRITFGGSRTSKQTIQKVLTDYRIAFKELPQTRKVTEIAKRNDAFCQQSVIDKQLVFEGKKINVLYNYAPIGFGGERLHFLIVPKEHKTAFDEVTEDEYSEVTDLAKKLINHFSQTRPIQDVYLFHKTGFDAGQTIPHWHMHMILTASKTQDFLGKLTVLKKMLFGSSPMKDKELKARVEQLRSELQRK